MEVIPGLEIGAPGMFPSHRALLAGTVDEGMLDNNHLITGHNPVHEPVMVGEVLVGLNCRSGRLYVDGTVGEGGHASAILDRMRPGGGALGPGSGPNRVSRRPQPGWRTTPPNFNCFTALTPNWESCWKQPGSRGSQASSWTWACLPCSCTSPSAAFLLPGTNPWTCGSTRKSRGPRRPPG